MELTGLLDIEPGRAIYNDVIAHLHDDQPHTHLNLIRSARPYAMASLARAWRKPIIYVTARVKRAYNVTQQFPVWLGHDFNVLRYTEPTPQFYERAPWGDNVIRSRLEALAALMNDDAEQPPLVVASARALMQRTIPPSQFRRRTITLEPGQQWRVDQLLQHWQRLGYEGVTVVTEPGQFSRRGGVVDVYPVAAALPVRVDFFDDEIDTLRRFDPATQRSDLHLSQVTITPAREALPDNTTQIARHLADWFAALPDAEDDMTTPATDYDELQLDTAFPYLEHYLPYLYRDPVNLLDYAPADALIVVEDIDELQDTVEELTDQAIDRHASLVKARQLPADHPEPYVDWPTINTALNDLKTLHLGYSGDSDTPFQTGQRYGGQLRVMLSDLRKLHAQGDRVIVVTEQAPRLTQLWHEQDTSVFVTTNTDLESTPATDALMFINGTLSEGWSLHTDNSTTHLLTDAEIFGWNRPEPGRRRTRRRTRVPESDYADWNNGDYVVHTDYGVGQFAGLRHRTIDGNEREYLVLQYDAGGMVFVPIHQADRVTKYIGADDTPPTLNTLGKQDWARVRTRVKKAVEEEAKELLQLYTARAKTQGHTYGPDTPWQHELEASFPYVETEDQLKAVSELKIDMESPQPMDRLICGDVGFGKTEVALRAAFKAVIDGKQVAVLVPTTVLAQQHFDTFTNRLAPFPIKVEMLSRFRSKEYQQRALPEIASGEIDIVIGTHRILSKDITFKDLGMVIIDEEQRFGVKQKEHFKTLRNKVDVLTLTATPIPRTLYMSLTGVRDISMIQTPPEERLPINTHVGRWDEHLVRQAVMRELERGGQIFFVHNRVKTIETLREQLEEIVPEARIIVGHGQMRERQLEGVMSAFAHGEYDMLLSTTIVESGIDIPNANTLIVDRADHFGMAQLYQLRGRVGRGAQQAYAYFFHKRKINPEARDRLETLAENTSLGAGFQISMRDLEIRGAGDILSTKQTGHVAAIGLNLYTQLLQQSIRRMKGTEPMPADAATTGSGIVIDLPIAAYVPEDWLPDMALRLQIYRRIAGLTTLEAVDDMREELRDRFGQTPKAVDGLLYQIEVKLRAQQARATHIMAQVTRERRMQIKLPYLGEVDREALAQHLGDDVIVSRTAVTFPLDGEGMWKLRLTDILNELASEVNLSESGEGVGL